MCGAPIQPHARFCSTCGARLESVTTSTGAKGPIDGWKLLAVGNAVLVAGAALITQHFAFTAPHTGWILPLFGMAAYVPFVFGWAAWSSSMAGRGREQTHLRTPLRWLAVGYAFQAIYILLEFVRVADDQLVASAVTAGYALLAIGAIILAIGFRLWARAARPVDGAGNVFDRHGEDDAAPVGRTSQFR